MKTNELMIGDLVITPAGIAKVLKIDGDNNTIVICQHDGRLNGRLVDEAEPIQLTPEILEKNGWEYNNYNNETEYEEEYYVDENGFDIHINGKKFEVRCIDAVNIQLKYLHELQHVLKLCGIDKTIVV